MESPSAPAAAGAAPQQPRGDDSASIICPRSSAKSPPQPPAQAQGYAGHLLLLDIDSNNGNSDSPVLSGSQAGSPTANSRSANAFAMMPPLSAAPPAASAAPDAQHLQMLGRAPAVSAAASASAAAAMGAPGTNFTPPTNYTDRADRTVSHRAGRRLIGLPSVL
jgi:hypothetical protein